MKRYQSNRGYEPEVLERLHKVQMEILEDFIAVCDKYDLKYFGVYGTTLGAVRHQGFIPWDDDIDVGMLREDYDKFFEIFEQELSDKYALLTTEIDERYACTVTHVQKKGTKFISEASQDLKCEQCIFMDIFPYDRVANGKLGQIWQLLMTNFWAKLLFLAGTAYPVIPLKGILGGMARFGCKVIHYFLKVFKVSTKMLYRNYLRVATAYNRDEDKEYVTFFENFGSVRNKINKNEIFPLKKMKFEYLEIDIPNQYHEYLSRTYGDYMQLPPEDKRVNHMPLVIDFGDK